MLYFCCFNLHFSGFCESQPVFVFAGYSYFLVICLVMLFAHLYNMLFIRFLLIDRNSLCLVDMNLSLFALNTFS